VDNWSLKHLLYFEHSGCAVVPEKSRVFLKTFLSTYTLIYYINREEESLLLKTDGHILQSNSLCTFLATNPEMYSTSVRYDEN
jgi:hypothetical protein